MSTIKMFNYNRIYDYFGWTEPPFNITSDPHFFYKSRNHEEALFNMIYGIQLRKGFVVITGEIGAGKTTICRMVIDQLDPETFRSALILNPYITGEGLLQLILEDFGLEVEDNSQVGMFRQLNGFLLKEAEADRNVILFIDEAQNLSTELFEDIRLLSNLETRKQKLLQIVFVGQPELRDKLEDPRLEQLKQRIVARYHIMPLSEDELKDYIYHRLEVSSSTGGPGVFFNDDAISEIYQQTDGVPRRINLLCDRTLMAAFLLGTKDISRGLVLKSASEI